MARTSPRERRRGRRFSSISRCSTITNAVTPRWDTCPRRSTSNQLHLNSVSTFRGELHCTISSRNSARSFGNGIFMGHLASTFHASSLYRRSLRLSTGERSPWTASTVSILVQREVVLLTLDLAADLDFFKVRFLRDFPRRGAETRRLALGIALLWVRLELDLHPLLPLDRQDKHLRRRRDVLLRLAIEQVEIRRLVLLQFQFEVIDVLAARRE